MRLHVSAQRVWLMAACAFLAGGSSDIQRATAQDASTPAASGGRTVKSVQDRVKIKPYTGPPIYLDQQEQLAPPTIVERPTIVEKYDDGTVWMERQLARFSDNHHEADGSYKEYYPSGKPFVTGTFQRGRQHGQWTYWFENGQVNRKATYKDGQPDGEWEVYREDGTLLGKRGFREGMRHGQWTIYDKTGEKPLREEHYDNGKRDGVWKSWFPSGQLKQQFSFRQGKRHGISAEWNEKGEKRGEISYADDKLDGTSTIWAPDGRKIVQVYKDGRLVSEKRE